MATRITTRSKSAVNISVKYTVIQRRHGLWLPIHEYYQFSLRECRQLEPGTGPAAKTRYECPACLKSFTELALPEHRCTGGQTGYPKINNSNFKSNQRWTPRSVYKPTTYKELK